MGREDAGIGLYLLAVLEKDPILCQQVREQVSLSFSHQEFLKWMDRNFLPEPGKEGSSFLRYWEARVLYLKKSFMDYC